MVMMHRNGEGEDHYSVLGVSPAASPDEIRSAYRQTARRLHTDVADQPDGGAMAAANAAWYVLRDSARRAEYDAARCSVDGAAHVPSVEPLDQWTPAPRRLPLVVFVTAILCVVVFALIFLIGFTQGPGSSG